MNKLSILSKLKIKQGLLLVHTQGLIEKGHILQSDMHRPLGVVVMTHRVFVFETVYSR